MVPQHTAIIGAGRIGQALAEVISHGSSGASISLWDKNPQLVTEQQPLSSIIPDAAVVFCCTPSWTVRDVLVELRPLLHPATLLVTLAKGCEASTGRTMAEVVADVLPDQPHAVLGGPMMAENLRTGKHGVAVLGSLSASAESLVAPLFADTLVELSLTTDINGVALCGCVKNIYAFLVGLSDAPGWSESERQEFFALVQQEFCRCAKALGAADGTIQGAAGLGDLLLTATSPSSYNRRSGATFAERGYQVGSSEATITLPSILKRLHELTDLPLLATLPSVLSGQTPIGSLKKFLSVRQ